MSDYNRGLLHGYLFGVFIGILCSVTTVVSMVAFR